MATLDAINSFSIKKESGNIDYPLSQKQYLIEPLRGFSGVNNLEEQLLIGGSKFTTVTTTVATETTPAIETTVIEYKATETQAQPYYTLTKVKTLNVALTTTYQDVETDILTYNGNTVATKTISQKKTDTVTSTREIVVNNL